MNWLDWTLIALIAFAAVKGFSRGFIVEVCSLLALVLGIWAGIHFSDRVAEAIGLETKSSAVQLYMSSCSKRRRKRPSNWKAML